MKADETLIGIIFAIASVGGVLGAALGGRIHRRISMRNIIIGTIWSNALLMPFYAVAPNVFFLGVISALTFFAIPVYSVAVLSYRLALIPDALHRAASTVPCAWWRSAFNL